MEGVLLLKLSKAAISGVVGALFLFGGAEKVFAAEYDTNSIVDYLNSNGEDYSFPAREKLAEEHGIKKYRGTAEQNIFLLNTLRGYKVEKPANTQEQQTSTEVEQEETRTQQPVEEAQQSVTTTAQQDNQSYQGNTFIVEATAYTAYCNGCSGITYTGQNLRANPNQKVIAVDPNVIPLGSRVYVEGYGEAIAGDTGGAIKGNRIDVFVPSTSEALNWGRRTVKVTVLN